MRVLVTGGAGFIGSAFVRLLMRRQIPVVVYDAITYAGDWRRIETEDATSEVFRVHGRIEDGKTIGTVLQEYAVDVIVNFAAESHVSRSVLSPGDFAMTDVVGTTMLLHEAARSGIKRFIQISTGEVYGEIHYGSCDETQPLRPRNPYAASKAGADLMVMAAYATFGLPSIIVRPCNNYGEWEDPEKFVARACCRVLEGLPIILYGDGKYVREWIYVNDCVESILKVLERGVTGTIYNIGSGHLLSVQEVAEFIHRIATDNGFGAPPAEYEPLRSADDRRHSLDSSKALALGILPRLTDPEEGLRRIFSWYADMRDWWSEKAGWREEVLSAAFENEQQ